MPPALNTMYFVLAESHLSTVPVNASKRRQTVALDAGIRPHVSMFAQESHGRHASGIPRKIINRRSLITSPS
jgi:hypothetical protein